MIKTIQTLRISCIAAILSLLLFTVGNSQPIIRFTVQPGSFGAYTPLWINLDDVTTLDESGLQLVEISGKTSLPLAFQVEQGTPRKLWLLVKNNPNVKGVRTFELRKGNSQPTASKVTLADKDGSLQVLNNNKPVFNYQYKTVYPPAKIDTFYKRSGFLHPVYAPNGTVLTNIQPTDHYHHFGIWNPWTKTLYEGKEIDFWNLKKHQGTVRYAGLLTQTEGVVFGGFSAYQKHIVYPDSLDILAINEIWDLKVFNTGNELFLWDFTSTLNAPVKEIILEEYRYGGFGFRATDVWTNKNSIVMTSEGKTRKDADGSLAKWCYITGETSQGKSTILFMAYPTNFNYPEPIRVWPENSNSGRGDVFFNFAPTKNKNWTLSAGKKYVLKYRVMVKDGEITKEEAENTWRSFAATPKIEIISVK